MHQAEDCLQRVYQNTRRCSLLPTVDHCVLINIVADTELYSYSYRSYAPILCQPALLHSSSMLPHGMKGFAEAVIAQ